MHGPARRLPGPRVGQGPLRRFRSPPQSRPSCGSKIGAMVAATIRSVTITELLFRILGGYHDPFRLRRANRRCRVGRDRLVGATWSSPGLDSTRASPRRLERGPRGTWLWEARKRGFVRGSDFMSVVPRPSTWASPINPSILSSILVARKE